MKTTQGRIAAALLAAVLAAAPAPRAEAAVFHDAIHTIQNILTQMLAYYQRSEEYRANAMRWAETIRHIQQEVIKITGFRSTLNIPLDEDLRPVAETRMVAELCGGGAAFSISRLMSSFSIDPEGDLLEQQRDACRRIQIAKNRKYNATVTFMQTLKPQLEAELKRLEDRRDASSEKGNVDAAAYDAAAFNNKLKVEFEAWEMQMKGYDAYIESMEDTSRTLARLALKGKPNVVRDLIRTTTLKAALDQ